MESRIALVGIIVEDTEASEKINRILHEYVPYIVGRMGIPYRKQNVCIISIVIDVLLIIAPITAIAPTTRPLSPPIIRPPVEAIRMGIR